MLKPSIGLISGAETRAAMNPTKNQFEAFGFKAKVFGLKGFEEENGVDDLLEVRDSSWCTKLFSQLIPYFEQNDSVALFGHSLGGLSGARVAMLMEEVFPGKLHSFTGVCTSFSINHPDVLSHDKWVRLGTSDWRLFRWMTKRTLRRLFPDGRVPIHQLYEDLTPESRKSSAREMIKEHTYSYWPEEAMEIYLAQRKKGWAALENLGKLGKLRLIEAVEGAGYEGDVLCPPAPKHIRRWARWIDTIAGTHFLPIDQAQMIVQSFLGTLDN